MRHALRSLLSAPGFTIAGVLSLAIGIGANTAIFSVVHALLIDPLPYADADRLAILWNRSPGLGIEEDWFSTAQYYDIKNSHGGFEDVAIAIGNNLNLTGDGQPERIGVIRMSSNLLPMLGVTPAMGRLFSTSEDVAGSAGVAILGDGTWKRRYGSDPQIIGRKIILNAQPFEIVGVLPASFALPREVLPTLGGAEDAEIVLPLPLNAAAVTNRNNEDYNLIGKLKPGTTVATAQAEMDALTARLRREHPAEYPPNGGLTFSVIPLQDQVVGDVRQPVLVLLAAVGCVLLVACANVASLMLSRALARQREIAVRTALGASRARIVGHLLTESVMVAVGGGALGMALAAVGLEFMRRLGQASVPRLGEIELNAEVLAFTMLLSIASGVIFGLAPALRVSRVDLQDQLKDSSRGSGEGTLWSRGQSTRRLLVIGELALSVMLLIGAGLLIRSFARLVDVPPGFNPSGTLTMELAMTGGKYNDAQVAIDTYQLLWERLAVLPGVTAAGGVSALPLSQMFAWGPIQIEGRTPAAGEEFINVDQRFVGGAYFRTMEIPIAGRLFNDLDTRANPRVAIIDRRMADTLWPGQDPIGKRVRTGLQNTTTPWITVVGVAGNVKQYTLDGESRMAMYLPHTQVPARGMNIVLRSDVDATSLTSAVKGVIAGIDPDLPVYRVKTMAARVDESLARRRFAMLLLGIFASIALLLSAIGIYGVVNYLVSQGTRELGIRLALGAAPRELLRMIIRGGMLVALSGVALGVIGAGVLSRFMKSMLFGVSATDPPTFVVIPALLAAVCLAASYLPARRASRIDPASCLRAE
jgi:predicted permease